MLGSTLSEVGIIVYHFTEMGVNVDASSDKFRESVGKVVAVDTETISLKDQTLLIVGIATSIDEAFCFVPGEFHHANEVLHNPEITKVYHNCFFDLEVMDTDNRNIGDTLLMAALLGLPEKKLSKVAEQIYDEQWGPLVPTFEMGEVLNEFHTKTCDKIPEVSLADKCNLDTRSTYNAYHSLLPLLSSDQLEAYATDVRLIPILLRLTRRGIRLDQTQLAVLSVEYEEKADKYRELCQSYGLENPGSPKQVAEILMDRGVLFPRKVRGKWVVSTDSKILKYIPDIVAQLVLKFRNVNYFLTHYVRPWIGEERAYTHFHLNAKTSRMSSTGTEANKVDRNLMNIPSIKKDPEQGRARTCFIPDSGHFTLADASQMQLRILAHLSQDPVMLRIYDEDGDIHQETADFFQMPRNTIIKSVNFGMVFGATAQTLMETANITDKGLAENLMHLWGKKYKRAWEWIQYQQKEGARAGVVYTSFGRPLYIPQDKGRAHAERCAVNYPIQGTEAESIKRWLAACDDTGKFDLAHVVHDEGVFDGYYDDLPSIDDFTPYRCPMNISHVERWQ